MLTLTSTAPKVSPSNPTADLILAEPPRPTVGVANVDPLVAVRLKARLVTGYGVAPYRLANLGFIKAIFVTQQPRQISPNPVTGVTFCLQGRDGIKGRK